MASASNQGNKTLVLTGYGGYDKVRVEQRPRPRPQENEVIMHIKATGINFAELMCRQGTYDRKPKCPAVMGLEASGVIVQVGGAVKSYQVGDEILCVKDFGLWTEYVALPEDHVFRMPKGMSFEDAAALPVNYLTAHMILFDYGNLRPNKKVLVHMAAGGVGVAATQICKTVPGVTVFGTSSASKHGFLRENGVHHPIDYRNTDYAQVVRTISPEGVDIVMDPLNGPDARKGFNLLRPLGKIIHFGAANGVSGEKRSIKQLFRTWKGTKNYSPLWDLHENKAACWFHLGHLTAHVDVIRSAMADVLEMYQQGHLKPKIDSIWPYDEVASAMARMHERKNIGKVVLTPYKNDKCFPGH